MASDQMLSKKQQQLEAGRKKLEEFRKKKAANKKAASNNSANSANGDLHDTKPPVSDIVEVTKVTPDSGSHVVKDEEKTIDVYEAEPYVNPVSSFSKPSANPAQTYSTDEKLDNNVSIGSGGYGVVTEKFTAFNHPEEDIHTNYNNFSNTRLEDAIRVSREDHLKDLNSVNPVTTQVSITKSSPERSHGSSFANNFSHNDQPANGSTYRDSSAEVGERNYNKLFNHHPVSESSSSWSSESISNSFRPEAVPSYNQTNMSSGSAGRRSRPSFLDSITVSRNSSATSLANAETDKANPFSSKVYPVDAPVSSNTQSFINPSSVSNFGINEYNVDTRNSFNSTKHNEDFAALEQHIEDLTQEKFSLQRALEASRVLAESLASENTALTDTYNQQGSVVNQLKSDIERLQDEINAQLVEVEAVRTEYGNARLECIAADERAKLLASEVIGLEEKALRLRSNELKLERKIENLEAEISSQKRKISSMEKDRQDLQSTIEALQEEKKLMQSKLRKAPAVNSVEIKKSPTSKKEVSTSTDDLVDENEDALPATRNLATQDTDGESDALSRNFGLEVSSSSIPPDQTRMIQNINTLISELALEKEELIQALSTESSLSAKLKDLNKELSHKLEVQTQRLELLTSQSMVSGDNIPQRKPGPRTVVDNTPYADEGDEVVERVLGWIMKLFPGGPSKRQTKHL
ncbi:BLISTER [Artemisia annua]|uniref:BLISTER n=1 Tax=Artemisia annua TaxID=35608 RepID=A0A2U1LU28_ARTAN|nr:BLISTER [Artemisia annua]